MTDSRAADSPLLIELRMMRLDVVLWILIAEVVLSVMLSQSPDQTMVARLFLERVCPLLFVPVFSSMLVEDHRRGTYEFIASAPGAWRVQARRLAVAILCALVLSAIVGAIWSSAAGLGPAVATMVAFGPILMLGAIAYVVSVVTLSETAALAVAAFVWAVEQSPMVATLFVGPLSSLYLFPLSGNGISDVGGLKAGIVVAAIAAFALGVIVLERSARWSDR